MVNEKSSPPAAQLLRLPCPALMAKTPPRFQERRLVSLNSFLMERVDSDCSFLIIGSCALMSPLQQRIARRKESFFMPVKIFGLVTGNHCCLQGTKRQR